MSDLYVPLLPADDGHGAGGQSGASMKAAPVDWVEPKPQQPDAVADPRRDDSALASNGLGDSATAKSGSDKVEDPVGAAGRGEKGGADKSENVEDPEDAAGRGVPGTAGNQSQSDGGKEAESEEEKEPEEVEDPGGAAGHGRGVPGTAGDHSQSGGSEEVKSEGEKEPGDAAGVSSDAAGEESVRSIESSSSESIDSQHSHANGMLKDMETDLAGASTAAARMAIFKSISRRLAESAAGSSMASEALSFSRAVEHFDPRKDRKKMVVDTEVSKAGRLLSDAACRAPSSEAAVAVVAAKLTAHSLDVLLLLDEEGFRPCAFLRAWYQRATGPEPTLPLHRRQRQEKLTDKRQVLFGMAVAAPLALLTTAVPAGVDVFPSAFGPWIAWIGALLWIAVTCGLRACA